MVAIRDRFGFAANALTADPLNVGMAAALAAQLVRVGVSRAVTVTMAPSLDTHGAEWATQHPVRLKAALDAVGALVTDLREIDPDLERTVVLVSSEFARTPLLNGDNGKDHHPWNSLMVVGKNVRGGVTVGVSDSEQNGVKVSLATGQADDTGVVLDVTNVVAGVLTLMGANSSEYLPSVAPLTAIVA